MTPSRHQHPITCVAQPPGITAWAAIPELLVSCVHPQSTAHHPRVSVRIAHSRDALHLRWQIDDRYVRSVCTTLNGPVCEDSCVEFFCSPLPGVGYFNLEINAGGTIHLSWYARPGAPPRFVSEAAAQRIHVRSSLPPVVEPEISGPLTWTVDVDLPLAVISELIGETVRAHGSWRANFYKCGDLTSQPHWLSWAPVGDPLSFHKPECFGVVTFSEAAT